jgi:hypothetical protein
LFWIIVFAIYAFVVSLLSTNIVSIAYSVQFLFYAVIGTILVRRYGPNFANTNYRHAHSIFFTIAVVYSVGMLISIFTGPIYAYQVLATHKHWGVFDIAQGVGFSEGQNMAGLVVMFFAAACIYVYQGKIWKKWILLTLLLSALLATLSRGAIFSFAMALGFVYCLDSVEPLVQRASIKVSVFKNIGFVISALSILVILIGLGIYSVNKPLLFAILSGFGFSGEHNLISSHMATRFSLWAWGLNTWASGNLLKMIFGGGFRSSMLISAGRGTWHGAHNVYITILGDFGIVGLTLFLVALFGAFLRYARLFLAGKAREIEKFGLLVLLALSIDNMTGPYFYSPVCLSLLIFTFAVTL